MPNPTTTAAHTGSVDTTLSADASPTSVPSAPDTASSTTPESTTKPITKDIPPMRDTTNNIPATQHDAAVPPRANTADGFSWRTIALAATAVTLLTASPAMAATDPAPAPTPPAAGQSDVVNPDTAAGTLRSAARNGKALTSGGTRRDGSVPADCFTPGVHVSADGTLMRVWTEGDTLYGSKSTAKLPLTPVAMTFVGTQKEEGTTTTNFIYLATDATGVLHRLSVAENDSDTGEVTDTTIPGGIGASRSMHLAWPYLYTLTAPHGKDKTPRLMRYTMTGEATGVTAPTSLGKGSWAAVTSLASRTTVTRTGKGTSVVSDQLRGITTSGSVAEIRVARTTTPTTTLHTFGQGWGGYRDLITGNCTKNPAAMPMLAITTAGRPDQWWDANSAKIPPTLKKLGTFEYTLPAGRVFS